MPAYAIDDQAAIKVTDGTVEVVSEGALETIPPQSNESRYDLACVSLPLAWGENPVVALTVGQTVWRVGIDHPQCERSVRHMTS